MQYVFDSIDLLEPKCPHCDTKIEYDVNTKYDARRKGHICLTCKKLIK